MTTRLKEINDMESGFRRLAEILRSVDLVVPAFFTVGGLSRLAGLIEKQATVELKQDILREALPHMYNAECLASFQLGLYEYVIYVKDYRRPIREAIEAGITGMYHAAVSTLLPILEGVITKIATEQGSLLRTGSSKRLIAELERMLEKETSSPHRYEERVVMLESLKEFYADRLLVDTREYDGLDQLNRHGILHGLYESYGADVNFYRLIAVLNLVCFALRLSHGGSAFGPADTPESLAFAAYLRRACEQSKQRPINS